jgi:hypothetical protein
MTDKLHPTPKEAPHPATHDSRLTTQDSLIAALEPDQLIATKEKFHCPRRNLTSTEKILFWALRIYLVLMFGVVIYQAFTSAR